MTIVRARKKSAAKAAVETNFAPAESQSFTGNNLRYFVLVVNRLAPQPVPLIVSKATGSPMGLRGLPDADDPMNLIRIMPAEGGAAHGRRRAAAIPSPLRSGDLGELSP
jgi:hypothetical protein